MSLSIYCQSRPSIGAELVQLIVQHRALTAKKLAEINLYIGQELLLKTLSELGEASQKQLVQSLEITAATVSKSVDRLAHAGLIEKQQSVSDKRQCVIVLTPKGQDKVRQIEKIWQDLDDRLFAGFSPAETAELHGLIARMTQNIQ